MGQKGTSRLQLHGGLEQGGIRPWNAFRRLTARPYLYLICKYGIENTSLQFINVC